MGGLFSMESRTMKLLSRITNIMILNLCFIISCLPIITAGAGLTALYAVNLKMVRDEEAYIFRGFWSAFKENFKQSTVCWLLFLIMGYIFVVDYRIVDILPARVSQAFQVVVTVLLLIYLIMLLYIFPYIGRFKDKLGISLKNAFLIGVTNIGYSFVIIAITAISLCITFFSLNTLLTLAWVWLLGGFSLLSFINSYFLRRVFCKYERLPE